MRSEARGWALDHRAMRPVFAGLVTLIAIGAFVTRDDEVVSWSLLGPTVAMFWIWALSTRVPSWPMHFLGLYVPLTLNLIESDSEISMFIAVVTVSVIASYISNRTYVRWTIGSYVFVMVTLGVVEAIGDFAWPNWLFGLVFAWGAGEIIWRFTDTLGELEETRALVSDQAALQERRRIARDVHDLVGHSLSVVLLHITGARHLVHSDPDEAERALEQAEAAGRQSLAEIRRTVGLLRDESDPTAPVVPSAHLTDVPTLVDDFAAAGLVAQLDMRGAVERVDPAIGLAGYRIAQEALTNVSRHSVGADVRVTIGVVGDACEIVVSNEGGEIIDLGRGAGFGLVSMRERAKSVGGSLVAGPTPAGWVVEASLPVVAAGAHP